MTSWQSAVDTLFVLLTHLLLGTLTMLSTSCHGVAQCSNPWTALDEDPRLDGSIRASVVWDRDGSGPGDPVLVVGGTFTQVGSLPAAHIAVWDPAARQWAPLGAGTVTSVGALAVHADGTLYVGCDGAVTSSIWGVGRWNGSGWSQLGTGFSGYVRALHVQPDGSLLAGGSVALNTQPTSVARWNGTSWSPLGPRFTNGPHVGSIIALATATTGEVIVGGEFTSIGALPVNHIARWSGTSWAGIGAGFNVPGTTVCAVTALAVLNGTIVAGGFFSATGATPVNRVARWTGSAWQQMGAGLDGSVYALRVLANGELVAGGYFRSSSTVPMQYVARWTGSTWAPFATQLDDGLVRSGGVTTLAAMPNSDFFATGDFIRASGIPVQGIARRSTQGWSALRVTPGGTVKAMVTANDGTVVMSYIGTLVGTTPANYIARWTGGGWTALGDGLDIPPEVLAVLPDGQIVAGGRFTASGATPLGRIARWDGTAWRSMGTMNGTVYALAVLPDGRLVAGGTFTSAGGVAVGKIAVWDGTGWAPFGNMTGTVRAFAVLPNGQLIAGGPSTVDGVVMAGMARWDGTRWNRMVNGAGFHGEIRCLAALPDGGVVAGGGFTSVDSTTMLRVARWNGSTWSAMDFGMNTQVSTLTVLPGGDVLAAGNFTAAGYQTVPYAARWNGAVWSAFDTGTHAPVYAVTMLPNGSLIVGGYISLPDANPLTRVDTTCPATVVPTGAGCNSSIGPMVLTGDRLPWVGGVFSTRCTGVAAGSLVAAALGLGQVSIPLVSLHPAGGAGCLLLTDLRLGPRVCTSAGFDAVCEIPLARDPSLVGLRLWNQVLQFEPAAAGVGRFSSSNAVVATVGMF